MQAAAAGLEHQLSSERQARSAAEQERHRLEDLLAAEEEARQAAEQQVHLPSASVTSPQTHWELGH